MCREKSEDSYDSFSIRIQKSFDEKDDFLLSYEDVHKQLSLLSNQIKVEQYSGLTLVETVDDISVQLEAVKDSLSKVGSPTSSSQRDPMAVYRDNISKYVLDKLMIVKDAIIPLDIGIIADIIDKNEPTAEIIRGKDVIILLGKSGAGKSTTAQYICGAKMERGFTLSTSKLDGAKIKLPVIEAENIDSNKDILEIFKVGGGGSCTVAVNAINLSQRLPDISRLVFSEMQGLNNRFKIYEKNLAAIRDVQKFQQVLLEMHSLKIPLSQKGLDEKLAFLSPDDKSLKLITGLKEAFLDLICQFQNSLSEQERTDQGYPAKEHKFFNFLLESGFLEISSMDAFTAPGSQDKLRKLIQRNFNIFLCDSPGFFDTKGAEQDVANGIGISKALRGAKKVRLLIVTGEAGNRCEQIEDLTDTLVTCMEDFDNHINSFSYVFTRIPKEDRPYLAAKIETFYQNNLLKSTSSFKCMVLHILESMRNKDVFREDVNFVDPLSKKIHGTTDVNYEKSSNFATRVYVHRFCDRKIQRNLEETISN